MSRHVSEVPPWCAPIFHGVNTTACIDVVSCNYVVISCCKVIMSCCNVVCHAMQILSPIRCKLMVSTWFILQFINCSARKQKKGQATYINGLLLSHPSPPRPPTTSSTMSSAMSLWKKHTKKTKNGFFDKSSLHFRQF